METLGERIKKLRTERNESLEAFGKGCGVTKPAVDQWERDSSIPSGPHLVAIAEYCEVRERWIVLGEEPRTPSPIMNTEEADLVAKYRLLDARGKGLVQNMLVAAQSPEAHPFTKRA